MSTGRIFASIRTSARAIINGWCMAVRYSICDNFVIFVKIPVAPYYSRISTAFCKFEFRI